MSEGLVVRIEPRTWTVEVDGREWPCSLRPRLFTGRANTKSPVAVGDRVRVHLEGQRGVIEEVLPRRNCLARPSPRDPEVLQVTAANLDQIVSVSAARDPPLRTGLIDRFQVVAERQGIDLLVVINKCDQGLDAALRARVQIYADMGYGLLFTSAETGEGVDELARQLRGRTSVLAGHSGAGKSSLLNRIEPGLGLRVGQVAKHGRGRHTTTSVSLWKMAAGGYLVDSPGIRGFGLAHIPAPELAILMPDLRPHTARCRFPDCTHEHEPGCEVQAAVRRGEVPRERYQSYVRMLHGIQGREDGDEL